MGQKMKFLMDGGAVAPPDSGSFWRTVTAPGHSRLVLDGNSNPVLESLWTCRTVFELLAAAAAAAGSDPYLLSLGTGTEVIARAAKGGINAKTQASTPASGNDVCLVPVANSSMIVPLTAVSQPRFLTRVNLTQISDGTSDGTLVTSALMFSAGFNETLTHVDPTQDAGDGAAFLYAPSPGVGGTPVALTTATGLAASTLGNWIAHQKVAGADTFIDTGVAVVAGVDYDLSIMYGADLIPLYYINGTLVATGTAVGTTGHSIGVVIGEKICNTTPAGQLDFDCRFVKVARFIG